MIFKELLAVDGVLGRRVWLLRHVPSGVEGEKYNWVTVAISDDKFPDTVKTYGLCGDMGSTREEVRNSLEKLRRFLRKDMGFEKIFAERNGKWREY